jgi:hypothetical protein
VTMTRAITYRGLRALADEHENGDASIADDLLIDDRAQYQCVYHFQDSADDPLVVILQAKSDSGLPVIFDSSRQAALDRMVSFVSRAISVPIILPHGWNSYQQAGLATFFAFSRGVGEPAPRWIAESHVAGTQDIVFWETKDNNEVVALGSFEGDRSVYDGAVLSWKSGFSEASLKLEKAESRRIRRPVGLDIELGSRSRTQPESVGKDRRISDWLDHLTPPQRDFVLQDPSRSLRLRGSAGSGKTLTMAIKAVREACNARSGGEPIKILYVTHSWALAGDVETLIGSLSEVGPLAEIDVAPLVFVAQTVLPTERQAVDQSLIGEDSLTGKRLQLAEIDEVLNEFVAGDWGGVRDYVTESFRERIESPDGDSRSALLQDLLLEFGCVLGADGILPSFNAESRYLRLMRAPWMMPLGNETEKKVVYALYEAYHARLDDQGRMTIDQLLNDFLNFLETNVWHRRRRSEGYDLIFVDEYHLFNIQERQLLRYLGKQVDTYPRIFMALDPRQSPYAVFAGDGGAPFPDGVEAGVVELPTVHRSSPEILELLKHVHLDFPNLGLDEDWGMNVGEIESSARSGPVPIVMRAGSAAAELTELYTALVDSYRTAQGGQIAVAVINEKRFDDVRSFVQSMPSQRYKVSVIEGRDDSDSDRLRRRGIVVGLAEHLAGLQFETVFVVGVPELEDGLANASYRRRRWLSLLYLAMSRASRELRIFVNDDAGLPPVLASAAEHGAVALVRGRDV